MDETQRYAVGIDVGTENVRAVVATVARDGTLSVVGYNEGENGGMRKGVVANLTGPAQAIDKMLSEVERMSGYEVNSAYVSINGAHVMSVRAEGMIATGTEDHEITDDDMRRVEEAAVIGRVPANRDIIDVLPLSYTLDGQEGIKDPMGMTGARLEMRASVISALMPNSMNLRRATEGARVKAEKLIPSVVAAGRAVLDERQLENGVAVVDMGAATTGVAVFEEGDLQYVGVVPMGSSNITNDLAIMLKIDRDVAEEIKRRFVNEESEEVLKIKRGKTEMAFEAAEVNQIIRDRLDEIFRAVRGELKTAKYDRKLPEGIVLVGGGSRLNGVVEYAREVLEASIKLGKPRNLSGVAEEVSKPEYAAAVGLAMIAAKEGGYDTAPQGKKAKKGTKKGKEGLFSRLFKV